MTGTVYSGINNIYRILGDDGRIRECRIKGKILSAEEKAYNPLAPGDRVQIDDTDEGRAMILERLPRRNRFARWNKKRENWQIVAANIDFLAAVISGSSPPFRPRFVDRVLICAEQGNVSPLIVVNKVDLGLEAWVAERLDVWGKLEIPVIRCSAETGEGMDRLREIFGNHTVALFGPSGVGKSTLINRLVPGVDLPTGDISVKYDRGRHVTNFGRIIDTPWGGRLVDTPGIRDLLIRGIEPDDLPHWFPELAAIGESCDFQPCSHRHEPGCAVESAVENGAIHPDRYENYLRIRYELEDETSW